MKDSRSPDQLRVERLASLCRQAEQDLKAATREALAAMGYTFLPRGRIGDVQAIELHEGKAIGAGDPRGIGKVVPE